MAEQQVIVSKSEEERITQLGEYFRTYLFGWLERLLPGIRYTPAVERELCLALLEVACGVKLSLDKLGTDDVNVEHAQAVAKRFLEQLEKETLDG